MYGQSFHKSIALGTVSSPLWQNNKYFPKDTFKDWLHFPVKKIFTIRRSNDGYKIIPLGALRERKICSELLTRECC
jgi:hypothetical protein